MEIKLDMEKNKDFKESINLISNLSTRDIILKGLTDKIEVMLMDSANVCMIIFRYKKLAMINYKPGGADEKISFKIEDLKQILKRMNKGEVTIKTTESHIEISNEGDKGKKKFSLPLVEVTEDKNKEPQLDYEGKIIIEAEELTNAIADTKIVEGSCIFKVENKQFSLNSGEEGNTVNVELLSECDLKDAVAKYSLDYLDKIVTNKLSDKIEILFKKDFPLMIKYENNNQELNVILAPRVEND